MKENKDHIVRHSKLSRVDHWIMAFSILILLATGIFPILGIKMDWIEPHWISGIILTIIMLIHLMMSLSAKKIKSMWISFKDLRDFFSSDKVKSGKYSLEQKLMHHAITIFSLISLSTGWLMMQKIDTPIIARDPFVYAPDTWGIIYVLHGLSTLFFVSFIMLHIYFSLRPEKMLFFRSMIKGWITKQEYNENYDPVRWTIRTNNKEGKE